MKSYLLSPALLVCGLGIATPALADIGLGVGLVTGDTHGITLKIPAAGASTVDVCAGLDFFLEEPRLRADWQQPLLVLRNNTLVVPFYFGFGGFLEPTDFGIRAPLGAAFRIQRTPVELFAQTSLEVTLIDANNDTPLLALSGAIGVRIYGI